MILFYFFFLAQFSLQFQFRLLYLDLNVLIYLVRKKINKNDLDNENFFDLLSIF